MMIGVVELINKNGSLPIEISLINSVYFNSDFDVYLLRYLEQVRESTPRAFY